MKTTKKLFTLATVVMFTLGLSACSEEKEEQTESKVSEFKNAASKAMDDAKEATSDAADKTKAFAEDTADKAEEMAKDAGNAIEDACEDAKEKMDLEDKDC
ncbi:hypothetical protein [Alteromonas gilva]|uniref:Late embryogenesis abundant protein n=1 Tax=Alteromonas gilva TaxID=2987522 RepID=A0ABT5KWU7_9ALTE|nr:hypothetical protein [Alteromonas gilva]MDC8829235.1 hypothetical protein [Alteromonas gilva]